MKVKDLFTKSVNQKKIRNINRICKKSEKKQNSKQEKVQKVIDKDDEFENFMKMRNQS